MKMFRTETHEAEVVRYPGARTALDGSEAIVAMETAASEAAGAYPITPSTQMGEGWALAVAAGRPNVHGRRLIFFEPEGEHAAAAVTAGMSLVGLRSTNFSSGQGIAYMHESLYPAVGKRLTYVLNMACRAMTKHALNVHAGHDDYHAIDDTGFFQLFAKDAQEAADLNLICHRIAELSLNPGICAQDGFLTSHVIETAYLPERELVKEYLGDPADRIVSPTPAQRLVFGEHRRRIPEMFDHDDPAMLGVVQNQDSYAQGVAAQRPFYFDHVAELTDRAFAEYARLTGRRYERAMGYRLDDAEYVLAGQGSVVANAEAVVDHLRSTKRLKVGVLDLKMFRPFPTDVVSRLLKGKRAVCVLERVDQPLAVDPPLLRELRAAMGKAVENARTKGSAPHAGVEPCRPGDVPDFYSACFGLGSRDLQPGDLVAAVYDMTRGGRRQFYLGIEFVRKETRIPKQQIWQEKLLDAYPHLADLSLPRVSTPDLMPEGAVSVRIHSVGGWGAITMGKNLALTSSELFGLHVKANPKYGSEKKGQPTTFYATLANAPIRLNCELTKVDVVLSPDPNVFRHSNPLAGLAEGGTFVMQWDRSSDEFWAALPAAAQRTIRRRRIRVFHVDAFRIAADEASDPELRYRMQGTAFMGAFFRVTPLARDHGLDEERLFSGIRSRVEQKFGKLGERVVDDNVRVIRRGHDEVVELDVAGRDEGTAEDGRLPERPDAFDTGHARGGVGDPGRFWEQVCHLYKTGDDVLADPFAAISAIPAATSTMRDMTDVRFEVPDFIPSKCTGCSQCWTQCPDAAIPGLVTPVDDLLLATFRQVGKERPVDDLRRLVKPLTKECRRILAGSPFTTFSDVLALAYETVVDKLAPPPEKRKELDREFLAVHAELADFPLTKVAPFFDVPEAKEKGTGGLLSITVNPEACKGCNICVDVCPDGALVTVKQNEAVVDRLRRHWRLWKALPDTDDRYVNVASLEEGIGVLPSLLLKKEAYRSMMGGDGACMGCGEKTALHLVLSAVDARQRPRVADHVTRLDDLIDRLDRAARDRLAQGADLDRLLDGAAHVELDVPPERAAEVERMVETLAALKDLRWRYTAGPSGKGRAKVGFTNSTGCSSVWGSTYPYNPYPFPWVNHLFQDAPSIAIGIFEGQMRKMADGFVAVRRAELLLSGAYDADEHEAYFARFDWREFTDDEFHLCPPLFAVGGDGAMMDIGFQNLSRLMASGKPIRVVVLDTQVYSNTGGQACTSGFHGQVSDMAAYGQGQHGKEETRKELALLAIAHRHTYVLQSSQAAPAHLLGGVLQGLQSKRPAVFLLHCPCPPEHGLPDDAASRAARLALECRSFPLLRYDPDASSSLADCLSLDGNPAIDDRWPSYELKYVDDDGTERAMTVPLTVADWACTEARFKKHFRPARDDEELVPFHELLERPPDEREGVESFIHTIDPRRRLRRLAVSTEIVELAEERLLYWSQLRQMAGLEVGESTLDGVRATLEDEFEAKATALRAEYETKMAELRATYPAVVARKMAEGLLRAGEDRTVSQLLAEADALPPIDLGNGAPAATSSTLTLDPAAKAPASPPEEAPASPPSPSSPSSPPSSEDELEEADDFAVEAFIDTARCTSCNECTNLNSRIFAYDDKKRAYVKDPRGGPFKDIVVAAERCPVGIIHPGTPLNPKEKDLEKWVKRAARFDG